MTTTQWPAPVAAPSSAPAVPRPPASDPGPPASETFPQARGESDRAFEAFRVYLELGPQRRYAAVGRKVGAALRTVKRWALDFDWRGRIKLYAAARADQFAATETAMHREELLDDARRAQTFRGHQYDVAEALLLAAERYLERLDDDALEQLSFADACKALDVASRLSRHAAAREPDADSGAVNGLREQLDTLLDQAFGDSSAQNAAAAPPTASAGAPQTSAQT